MDLPGYDAKTSIHLRSSHRKEVDGTHTVMVTISGLPDLEWSQRVSHWMSDLVLANASQIGQLVEQRSPKDTATD